MAKKYIKKIKLKLVKYFRKKVKKLNFYNIGFHGDKYLLEIVDNLLLDCEIFIETGANTGTTLIYTAKKYPHIKCFSCEPDIKAFELAKKNIKKLNNIFLFNESSKSFMKRIEDQYTYLFNKKILFWLDAHGHGFTWPLREEINFVTKNFNNAKILIDDFKIPNKPNFGYDMYNGQECSFEYIRNSIHYNQYKLIYPAYNQKTSKHHPLRGWGLIVPNGINLNLNNDLANKVTTYKIAYKN